jgi:hypothetical protein
LSKAPTNPIPSNARLNNSIVDGLQSEALNSLDATYVFVRQTKSAIDGLLFDNKNATKTSLCRRYFDNGAGYTNTMLLSQTLTHLDRKNVGGIQL